MMDIAQEDASVKRALEILLNQDVCTNFLDNSLDYRISDGLERQYNELKQVLDNFSRANDLKAERENLQLAAIQYRLLIQKTMVEISHSNININRLSPNQMQFSQRLVILGGKLQSFTQLLATSANHAKIYDRLREAAILNELDGVQALDYLRNNRKSQGDVNTVKRSDIKEIVTTKTIFSDIKGIDDITSKLARTVTNIKIGLIESFLFMVFYGIPGTGKTTLAEAVASDFSNGEFYKFDQSFFASTYLGVTESRIRNIFENIRSNPDKNFVIIIDEADNILAPQPRQPHLNSVKILLQTEIGGPQSFGPNLIIIAITNYLRAIDQTFLRRTSELIRVPNPPVELCLQFLLSRLTPSDFKHTDAYASTLLNAFNSAFVYTNSDMTRLAKNIRDTFLYNPKSDKPVTFLIDYENQNIFLFDATQTEYTKPVPLPGKPGITTSADQRTEFTSPYIQGMDSLYDILQQRGITMRSYGKFYAPNIENITNAITNSSTLTNEDSKRYE